MVYMYIWF